MTNKEVEVKFYLHDADAVRRRITDAGGVFGHRESEINIRLDTGRSALLEAGALLRLRKTDTRCLLTYKEQTTPDGSGCKVYEELEVTVSDFEKTTAIFSRIGYGPVQRYEKIRETYAMGEAEVCIDAMPYGTFLEIEASPAVIRDTAEKLGFRWKDRILGNYLGIFEALRKRYRLGFNDVTFENFRDSPVNFGEIVHLFTASD